MSSRGEAKSQRSVPSTPTTPNKPRPLSSGAKANSKPAVPNGNTPQDRAGSANKSRPNSRHGAATVKSPPTSANSVSSSAKPSTSGNRPLSDTSNVLSQPIAAKEKVKAKWGSSTGSPTNPSIAVANNVLTPKLLAFELKSTASAETMASSASSTENNNLPALPLNLPKAIQDEEGLRAFLRWNKWPEGLAKRFFAELSKVPIRFFLFDNSGSMVKEDGKMVSISQAPTTKGKPK